MVPQGTKPSDPSSICHSTKARKLSSSTEPSLNGVIRAGSEPSNIDLLLSKRPKPQCPEPEGRTLRSIAGRGKDWHWGLHNGLTTLFHFIMETSIPARA